MTFDIQDDEYIESALMAENEDGIIIEFYQVSSISDAKAIYQNNKTNIENSKGNMSSSSYADLGNYDKYSLQSRGYYIYICRVDDTIIYTRVEKKYKCYVKRFIKKLGYYVSFFKLKRT